MCFIYIFLLHPFCKVEFTAPLYRGQSWDLESDWTKISTLPTSPTTISHLHSCPITQSFYNELTVTFFCL